MWAYAYEVENVSLVSDAQFDAECRRVNPAIATDRPALDYFFATQFDASTGIWIHHHPELDKIKKLYNQHFKGMTR